VCYCYLDPSDPSNGRDLSLLQAWCKCTQAASTVLIEAVHPIETARPVWASVKRQIEAGEVAALVVPSLYHIAGNDFVGLSKILDYLKQHKVALKALKDVVDTRGVSGPALIAKFYQDNEKSQTQPSKGGV
jgi:hypothetical protein